jgi:uncharacterized protein (TIGR03067 family)
MNKMNKTTEALQGTWQYLTLKVEGKALPTSSLAESSITIEGNKFRVASPDESYQGTFTIDEDETPHTIDITFKEGPAQGKCLGIFELEKDSMKICLGLAGRDRPTSFASKPGSGHALETLRRASAKAAGAKAKAAGAKAKAAGKELPAPDFSKGNPAELARIQGTWTMVSGEYDGQPMYKSDITGAKRIAKGDETTVLINGAVFLSARMLVDPSKKPKTIDYLLTTGINRGKTQLGIYELNGDRLTLCFGKPNKERPGAFSAGAGSRRTLSVWKLSGDA